MCSLVIMSNICAHVPRSGGIAKVDRSDPQCASREPGSATGLQRDAAVHNRIAPTTITRVNSKHVAEKAHETSGGGVGEVIHWLLRPGGAAATRPAAQTSLWHASWEGHANVVHALLRQGAAVNDARDGTTPLWVASRCGHADAVRELLAHGASVDATGAQGTTPLWVACQGGHLPVVHELLGHGADATAADATGATPLWVACWKGHITVVRTLQRRGAAVEAPDANGRTPLAVAARGGHLSVMRELLRGGADPQLALASSTVPTTDAFVMLSATALWLSDGGCTRVCCSPVRTRARPLLALPHRLNLVHVRRLRHLLRALVDPRCKERRRRLFARSPLRLLPWHVAVHMLGFLVLVPIRHEWGQEEFERSG
mmetsp:Transcript_19396/g.61701  ORF Transcript_19396/g.61701 Transcript_19396/m.61701 type:complete len:372 (+) Transcript_19396:63-1178(+)